MGINKDNSAPKRWTRQHRPNMNLHAEIDALLGVSKENAKNAIMYIWGNPKVTRPCESCMAAIKQMGLKKVIYLDNKRVVSYVI